MQVDTTFIKNEWYTNSQFSVWIHSDQKNTSKSTSGEMERPTNMEEAWMAAAAAAGDNTYSFMVQWQYHSI